MWGFGMMRVMGEGDLDAGISAALLDTMQKRTALVLT